MRRGKEVTCGLLTARRVRINFSNDRTVSRTSLVDMPKLIVAGKHIIRVAYNITYR